MVCYMILKVTAGNVFLMPGSSFACAEKGIATEGRFVSLSEQGPVD